MYKEEHNRISPRAAVYWLAADDPTPIDERIRLCAQRFAGRRVCAQVARSPRGRPYFPHEPSLHLSISHSADVWACAISDAPVGLDIEYLRPCDFTRIAARFFHPDEADYVRQGGEAAFFEVWTAKESFVKCTGQGIDGSFSDFCVVRGGRIAAQVNGLPLRHIPFREKCSLCVCGAGARDEVPVICLSPGAGL